MQRNEKEKKKRRVAGVIVLLNVCFIGDYTWLYL